MDHGDAKLIHSPAELGIIAHPTLQLFFNCQPASLGGQEYGVDVYKRQVQDPF